MPKFSAKANVGEGERWGEQNAVSFTIAQWYRTTHHTLIAKPRTSKRRPC